MLAHTPTRGPNWAKSGGHRATCGRCCHVWSTTRSVSTQVANTGLDFGKVCPTRKYVRLTSTKSGTSSIRCGRHRPNLVRTRGQMKIGTGASEFEFRQFLPTMALDRHVRADFDRAEVGVAAIRKNVAPPMRRNENCHETLTAPSSEAMRPPSTPNTRAPHRAMVVHRRRPSGPQAHRALTPHPKSHSTAAARASTRAYSLAP